MSTFLEVCGSLRSVVRKKLAEAISREGGMPGTKEIGESIVWKRRKRAAEERAAEGPQRAGEGGGEVERDVYIEAVRDMIERRIIREELGEEEEGEEKRFVME